jgi:hypothetical protein
MSDDIKRLDEMLRSAFRRPDCPSEMLLENCLLGLLEANKNQQVLHHLSNCPFCREEVRVFAELAEITLPSECLGISQEEGEAKKRLLHKALLELYPHEACNLEVIWQAVLRLEETSFSHIPEAAAAFSAPSNERVLKLGQAVILLSASMQDEQKEQLMRKLSLTGQERETLRELFC